MTANTWKLQDAKAQFSEVVRRAKNGAPQEVTVHGKKAVEVVDLERWVRTEVLSSSRGRRLPVTTEISVIWLQLSRKLRIRGETKDPSDLLLASTAKAFGLTLVTRNTRHFAKTGITVYNPWTDETQ